MKSGTGTLRSRFVIRQLIVAVILSVGIVGVALILLRAQTEGQRNLESLFQVRGTIGARFVQSYVNDVFSREQLVARTNLSGRIVTQNQLNDVLDTFGFNAGVLLDRRGRLLLIAPAHPALVGHVMTIRYAHLRAAAAGHRAVSKVVPSAARGTPVVAFALPYDTPYGRRVLSGGFDVSQTPIGAYLQNALPQSGTSAYVVDDTGTIVASNGLSHGRVRSLRQVDGDLLAAMAPRVQGPYKHAGAGRYFVVRGISGSPWRLVLSVPQDSLYGPVLGTSRWLPWVLFLAIVLGSLYALWLLFTLANSRARLVLLYSELDRVARLDGLTAVYNRRQLDEDLGREVAGSRRYGRSAAFILLDLDHFKQANDRYGHQVGDTILQQTAAFLTGAVRDIDRVYRYGGEEFAVIAPDTHEQGAHQLTERLRAGIEESLHPSGNALTASFGVALIPGSAQTAETVISAADRALYEAKAAGRNQVVFHSQNDAGTRGAGVPV